MKEGAKEMQIETTSFASLEREDLEKARRRMALMQGSQMEAEIAVSNDNARASIKRPGRSSETK